MDYIRLLLLLILLALVGCQSSESQDSIWNNERLIVWHTWEGSDAAVIEMILDDFADAKPNVSVTVQRAGDQETAVSDYALQAEAGLGPDVLIGISDPNMVDLFESQLTVDLANLIDTSVLDERALKSGLLGDQLIGVPFSTSTSVVYYNTSLVDSPPETLGDIITIADSDVVVGITINPLFSLWGVHATGGKFFDDTNQVALNQNDAFTLWLQWLDAANTHANIVLSDDYETLFNQFQSGEIGLLVGSSFDYPDLLEIMGSDTLGVAILPEDAGSILLVESMVINRASSNVSLAVELVEFVTNNTQQRTLAVADGSHTALNLTDKLDPRMFKNPSTMQRLVAAGEVLPSEKSNEIGVILRNISVLYSQVLDGIIEPEEAAELLQQEIDSFESDEE